MKYLFPIFLLLLLSSCRKENLDGGLNPDYEFNGSVKTVKTQFSDRLSEEFGQVKIIGKPPIDVWTYNRQGYPLQKKTYTEDEPLLDTMVTDYYYDDNGSLIARKIHYGGQPHGQFNYTNDVSGKLLEQKITYARGGGGVITYEYDSLDRLVTEYEDMGPGSQVKWVYHYDEAGNKTGKATYLNSKLERHWKYYYDAEGRLIREADLHHIKDWADETRFTYDREGRLVESFRDRASLRGAPFQEKITYRYNEQGEMIEKITENNKSRKHQVWEYVYDEQGNWTSKIRFLVLNGQKKADWMMWREFDYY